MSLEINRKQWVNRINYFYLMFRSIVIWQQRNLHESHNTNIAKTRHELTKLTWMKILRLIKHQ